MKLAMLLFSAILIGLSACNDDTTISEPTTDFEQIERLVAESPANVQEEFERLIDECGKDVFTQVEDTIEQPTSKGCTYRVKADKRFFQHEQMKTGLKHNEELFYTATYVQPSQKDIAAVPETWSFYDFGKAALVPVTDQDCGDCWSQACTNSAEFIIAARDGIVVDLAVQNQISRCSSHGDCSGGYMSCGDFVVKTGNSLESSDPYQGRNSSCKFSQQQLQSGLAYKMESSPWVGSSLNNSRFFHQGRNGGRRAPKPEEIKAMMVKLKSPSYVTLAAISSSGGIINRCSAINSGGNHMQSIIGWDKEVVKVRNSWGRSHGNDGDTWMIWQCPGGLNRGLGRAARVYEYKTCENPANPYTGAEQTHGIKEFTKSSPEAGVWIGRKPTNGQKCKIIPTEGLSDFDESGCRAFASPDRSIEYHIEAYSKECDDTKSAMVMVKVYIPGRDASDANVLLTPHGVVDLNKTS